MTQCDDPRWKMATNPEQWEFAGEILDKGIRHPAFARFTAAWDRISQGLAEAKKRSDRMRRVGVGHTEDPSLIEADVLPELELCQEELEAVIAQLRRRLGV